MDVRQVPGYRNGSIYFTCAADRGYFYVKRIKKPNGIIYLDCTQRKNGCPAKASCNDHVFLNLGQKHHHPRDETKEEALVLKQKMLTAAAATSDDIKTIFVRNSSSASVEAASHMAFPATSKAMRRERKKTQPKMPTSIQELGDVCKDNTRFGFIDQAPFCRGAVGEANCTSVIFLAENLTTLLSDIKEIHVDGTFKTRPRHPTSSQLLTITVIKYGMAFPCAFALMSSKTTSAYNAVFSKIKELMPRLSPQLIMTDYEAALIKSLGQNFPDSSKSGCLFHYCQAIMKQVGTLGMKRLITDNPMAQKALKFLLCLPLLPADKFTEAMNYINSFLQEHGCMGDFEALLRYHERQWLGRVGANSVSVYNRKRRTNNDAESLHASLLRILRIKGPNVWEFIDGLQHICATTIRELRAFVDQGLEIRSLEKRKYRLNDRRIQNATAAFSRNQDVGSFLDIVSSSIQGIINRNITDVETPDEEEPLLVALEGDIPAAFDHDMDDDETLAAPDPTAVPPPRVPYPQLGLVYDPADEDIFHLPEDAYESIPLEAFEAEPELELENTFRGYGYDEEAEENLPVGDACPICGCRKKVYALVNCGHLLCGYCTTQSYNPVDPYSRCPVCRSSIINEPMRIYL